MPTLPPTFMKAPERKPWRQSDRRTRQERGYGKEHERIRKELMRTVILCEICTAEGRTTAGEVADHIVPLAKGGSGDRSNYRWICKECHARVTAEEFGRTGGGTPSGS